MKTFDEAMATARDGSPFSNSTQWEIWADRWCYTCSKDSPELVDKGQGCPLITVALMERTPAEWTAETEEDRVMARYTCSEYEERPEWPGDDDPDSDPDDPDPTGPAENVPGQVDIFQVWTDQVVEQATDLVGQATRPGPER